ncbi:helicase-related protein [Kribbella sp. C-35]|uniref:helicase-related protein n=1 Tax=Kribbella sp. C-35 TaxID=2789276 RepID=UPI003979725A
MTLTEAQQEALAHLRSAYVGPEGGPDEIVYNGRPDLQYTVGMLYPPELHQTDPTKISDVELDDKLHADVIEGDVEDANAGVPLAEDWRPSSVAVSFVVDGPTVLCDFAGGTYSLVDDDGPPKWQRSPFAFEDLKLSAQEPPRELKVGDITVQIGSRWRPFGSAFLVTVHARVTTPASDDTKRNVARTIYQVRLAVTAGPEGRFLEYDTAGSLDVDAEAAELRLRYRKRKTYAVGHGMAADWQIAEGGVCERIFLDAVPSFVVPDVETISFESGSPAAEALRLDVLARVDTEPDAVAALLDVFVQSFTSWVAEQESRVAGFGAAAPIAGAVVARSRTAASRMHAGVELLRRSDQGKLRSAFALGMAAMRLQMRQIRINEGKTSENVAEPTWRPFQLGFILVSLASTVDEHHADRKLVDLIWFPTGGGKTEAYLGLAAIEMFRRRLVHGIAGGGTAVITRYTLRLLTAQQFHRASALICAMELLRRPDRFADERAQGMAPFSIGLWVGNEVTPGGRYEAKKALERLYKANRPEEANQFQIEGCPWCGTPLVPRKYSPDPEDYGMRQVGQDVVIRCTNTGCPFREELPVAVVDQVMYDNPPTFLLATVDKFARLQFNPEAGRLLGLNTPFRLPSMIIQDELHLLSGPLGTTVAVFDAMIQRLLESAGSTPKIVASTATIRASEEQVRGLYGREVALYPPSGLDDDRNFFSRPVTSGEGRLYVGLMPQSVSQASAVIAAVTPLIELPEVLGKGTVSSMDDYWTAVLYHNSLRELGRTGTLVVDDVNARLEARADRLALAYRKVRPDRVLELTSRRRPEELPNDLRELGQSVEGTDEAIDVVLSSNMLSVGIDIPRLALMLMIGQPKTTAEYIQATSRVGRGDVRGVVTTLFRSNRARDRSHFETFRSYHESLYRTVEPTSVTPWSVASRERSLRGALVLLMRHSFGMLASNTGAVEMNLDDGQLASSIEKSVDGLRQLVARSDATEVDETTALIRSLLNDWDRRAGDARHAGQEMVYNRRPNVDLALLKRFGQSGEGWLVADSMRSVEPNVAIEVREPMEGSD